MIYHHTVWMHNLLLHFWNTPTLVVKSKNYSLQMFGKGGWSTCLCNVKSHNHSFDVQIVCKNHHLKLQIMQNQWIAFHFACFVAHLIYWNLFIWQKHERIDHLHDNDWVDKEFCHHAKTWCLPKAQVSLYTNHKMIFFFLHSQSSMSYKMGTSHRYHQIKCQSHSSSFHQKSFKC